MKENKLGRKILIALVIFLVGAYLVFALGSAYRFFGFYSDSEKEIALEEKVKTYLLEKGLSETNIVEVNAFWNEKVIKFEAYAIFSKDVNRKFYFYEHEGVISNDCDFSEEYLKEPCT